LKEQAITAAKIENQTITGEKIAPQTITGEHIALESITGDQIAANTITGKQIAPLSITGFRLAPYTITGENIAPRTIGEDKLLINPVQTTKKNKVTQQFGMVPFSFRETDRNIEICIEFEQPYLTKDYVIVAMTNLPTYFASLKEQTEESATITITHLGHREEISGILSWIAIGTME
jgi:hypothetical protein